MRYKINKGLALTLASNPEVFARGEKYFRDGRVKTLEIGGRDSEIVRAKVSGAFKDYTVALAFTPDGTFGRYACDCDGSAVWRGACKHVVAALLALMGAERDNGGGQEQRAAQNVLRRFESQLYAELAWERELSDPADFTGRLATLSPTLHAGSADSVSMELKIGQTGLNRMYVVRNIKNFITHVNAGDTVSYGKSLAFRHTPRAFDERSAALIATLSDFFSALADVNRLSERFAYRSVNVNAGERFLMSGKFLDDFFDIYEDCAVNMVSGATGPEPRGVLLTSAPPAVMFRVSFGEGKASMTGEEIAFCMLEGEKYSYFCSRDKLHRLERRQSQCLAALLPAFAAPGAQELTFEGSDYEKFTSFVLPRLQEFAMLDPTCPPPPHLSVRALAARLYFDVAQGCVTCRAAFCYGEEEFDPIAAGSGAFKGAFRDALAEARLVGRLRRFGFEPDKRGGHFTLAREELIYDLYAGGLDVLREFAECYATDEFNRQAVRPVKKAAFGVRLRGDLLALTLDGLEYSAAELLEALGAHKKKKRFHRLKDGSFLSLEDENIRACADTLAALDISGRDIASGEEGQEIHLPMYRALYLDGVLPGDDDASVSRDAAYQALIDDITNFRDTDFTLPETLTAVLRDYQKTGFKWLKTLARYGFAGVLADEMGLGKTLQVIAVLLSEKERAEGGETPAPSLVVTPTSLMYNWEREFQKFAPRLTVTVLAGLPERRRELLLESPATDVFITTYDTLKRDIDNYGGIEFSFVVADEAQYIKNPGTQNAMALKSLKSRARFALTGTPIENALSELWSIFDFLMPGYLRSAGKFAKLYETPIVKDGDQSRAALLQKQIAPFMLRRFKTDVLKELPAKVETTLFAEMEPEQRKIYAAYLLQARGELDEQLRAETASNKIAILAQLTRLRQICCHPSTFMDGYQGGSGKLNLTIETIFSAVDSGHRVLLFSQFTSMLDILRGKLAEQGLSAFYLDGATESRLRANMAEKFNNGEKSVFLISLRAGGTGLNLTGADVVIHYDQWWNPAVMSQAADRAHRYGQKKVVQVINVVTKDTIEEKIISLQSRKKELVDAVLTQSVSFINRMTVDELRELFKDC